MLILKKKSYAFFCADDKGGKTMISFLSNEADKPSAVPSRYTVHTGANAIRKKNTDYYYSITRRIPITNLLRHGIH